MKIGIDVKEPKEECEDKNCPFHGHLKVRGRGLAGTVVSDKMAKTVTIQWERRILLSKYERYAKKRSKIKAHNPPCINAKEGDVVKVMECRPLSKVKNFCVVENLGKQKGYVQRKQALQEAQIKERRQEEKEEQKEESDDKE